jgi:hypothetical protein
VLFLCELARGSMGELIGVVDTREGTFVGNALLLERVYLSILGNFTYLLKPRAWQLVEGGKE